jgi:hypothetical protein
VANAVVDLLEKHQEVQSSIDSRILSGTSLDQIEKEVHVRIDSKIGEKKLSPPKKAFIKFLL